MADPAKDRAAWQRIEQLVRERTRLRITERNRDLLQRLVRRRIGELDLSLTAYVERLQASTPESGEFEHVTRELTVGETYFFRGPQLEDIRAHLLPLLVSRRREDGLLGLRLLSAGCATGEEAYTLVMMLSEMLEDFSSWQIDVIGLDINTAFLRAAEEASYSDWSLRDVAPATVARHFVRRDDRYHVRPELGAKVRFCYANLALDPLPAPALGVLAMDLVVCQNVLYYFDQEARLEVAEKLARCLAPDGYLVFGPADLLGEDIPLCKARTFGGLVAFRRGAPSIIRLAPPPSSRPPRWRVPTPPPLPAVQDPQAPDSQPEMPVTLEAVREIANEGDLQGALCYIDDLLAAEPEQAEAHALHGFLLTESGQLARALDAFRRATYLDPELLLAHAGAAMTARRLGQQALARRAGARVRTLADRQPADTLVDGWEGMTTGRLLRLFQEPSEGSMR